MRRGPNRVAQNWRSHSTLPRNRGARAVTRAAVCLSDIAFGRPPSAGPTIAASRDRAGVRTGVPRVVLGDVPCASVTYRRERRTGRHRRVHHSRRARPRGAAETGVTAPWSPANDGRPVCVGLQAARPTLQRPVLRCWKVRRYTCADARRRDEAATAPSPLGGDWASATTSRPETSPLLRTATRSRTGGRMSERVSGMSLLATFGAFP